MNSFKPPRRLFLVGELTVLLARWKELSQAMCRPGFDDWQVPAVDAVAASVDHAENLRNAARDLGGARFHQGVYISEAMQDFFCLFEAAGQLPDSEAVQALVEGWVTASESAQSSSCTDTVTGMSTPEHFDKFLHELSNPDSSAKAGYVIPTIPSGLLPPLGGPLFPGPYWCD